MAEEQKVTRDDMVAAIGVAKSEISDYVRREGADQHALNRCFAGLDAAAVELRKAEKWQPIETAPKDRTLIFGMRKGWDTTECVKWDTYYVGPNNASIDTWCFANGDYIPEPAWPTHWLLIPPFQC